MTTTERTIWMYNQLPTADQAKVATVIERLFNKREAFPEVKMKPLSRGEIHKRLNEAEEDIKAGRVHTWAEIKTETRRRYAL